MTHGRSRLTFVLALLTLAAFLRVFGSDLSQTYYQELLQLAGAAWLGAFGLFVATFAPILVTPRLGAAARDGPPRG